MEDLGIETSKGQENTEATASKKTAKLENGKINTKKIFRENKDNWYPDIQPNSEPLPQGNYGKGYF